MLNNTLNLLLTSERYRLSHLHGIKSSKFLNIVNNIFLMKNKNKKLNYFIIKMVKW